MKLFLRSLPSLFLVFAILAGCGRGSREAAEKDDFRVILDFLPNPLHIGIFHAQANGWYAEAGLHLTIDQPTSTSDTLRLMSAGRADLGLVPMIDFLAARQEGEDIRIVASVVQHPLAALHGLKESGIERPRDFENGVIGISGVLSDEVIARQIVAADGGDPASLEFINIGFNVIQNLVAGRVDGAIGFWNHEGVQLRAVREAVVFREDEWGIPTYPGIVAFAPPPEEAAAAEALQTFLAVTARGYEAAVADPKPAIANLSAALDGSSPEELKPHFEALKPVYLNADAEWGYVNEEEMKVFLQWIQATPLFNRPFKPDHVFTNQYLPDRE